VGVGVFSGRLPEIVKEAEAAHVVAVETSLAPEPLTEAPAPTVKSKREQVIELAESMVGITEATGRNDGPEVAAILRSAGINNPAEWCGASICHIYKQLQVETPNGCAWSPSWFPKAKRIEADEVRPGDVFGQHVKSKGRIGHVGIIQGREGGGYWITLEGNISDKFTGRRLHPRSVHAFSNWIDP